MSNGRAFLPRHGIAPAVFVWLVWGCNCWMGTTEVEVPQPVGGQTIVRGEVFHQDGSARHAAAFTWVRVTWLRRSGDGYAPITARDVQGANGRATFEVRTREGAVAGIRIECLSCRLDPTDPALACCLLDAPSCPNCDRVWTWSTEYHFQAGTENNLTLIVQCV